MMPAPTSRARLSLQRLVVVVMGLAAIGCSSSTDDAPSAEVCLARSDRGQRDASQRAFDLSRAAPPARRVRLTLGLDDPPFDFGAYTSNPAGLQAARTRQLAPLQAPTIAWLRDRGATDITPFWVTNMVYATIEARFVDDALCAPNSRWVDVNESWYDVVEPTWDPQGVGPGECPLVEGRCPAHCSEVSGNLVDGPNRCEAPARTVACSRTEFVVSNHQPMCRVQRTTGHRYVFIVEAPLEPTFVGWRECTEAEAAPTRSCP